MSNKKKLCYVRYDCILVDIENKFKFGRKTQTNESCFLLNNFENNCSINKGLQASDSSMNQDKDLKVEVRRGKEKKVKAPF